MPPGTGNNNQHHITKPSLSNLLSANTAEDNYSQQPVSNQGYFQGSDYPDYYAYSAPPQPQQPSFQTAYPNTKYYQNSPVYMQPMTYQQQEPSYTAQYQQQYPQQQQFLSPDGSTVNDHHSIASSSYSQQPPSQQQQQSVSQSQSVVRPEPAPPQPTASITTAPMEVEYQKPPEVSIPTEPPKPIPHPHPLAPTLYLPTIQEFQIGFTPPTHDGTGDDENPVLGAGGQQVDLDKDLIGNWLSITEFLYTFRNLLDYYDVAPEDFEAGPVSPVIAPVQTSTADAVSVKSLPTSGMDTDDSTETPKKDEDTNSLAVVDGKNNLAWYATESVLCGILHPTQTFMFRRILTRLLRPLIAKEYAQSDLDFIELMARSSQSSDLILSVSLPCDLWMVDYMLKLYISHPFVQRPIFTNNEYGDEIQTTLQRFLDMYDERSREVVDIFASMSQRDRLWIVEFLITRWVQSQAFNQHIDLLFGRVSQHAHTGQRGRRKQYGSDPTAITAQIQTYKREISQLKRETRELEAMLVESESELTLIRSSMPEVDQKPFMEKIERLRHEFEEKTAREQRYSAELDRCLAALDESEYLPDYAGGSHLSLEDLKMAFGEAVERMTPEQIQEQLMHRRFFIWNQRLGLDRIGREFWLCDGLGGVLCLCSEAFMKIFDETTSEIRNKDGPKKDIDEDDDTTNHEKMEDERVPNGERWFRFTQTPEELASVLNHMYETGLRQEMETWKRFVKPLEPAPGPSAPKYPIPGISEYEYEEIIWDKLLDIGKAVLAPFVNREGDERYRHFKKPFMFLLNQQAAFEKWKQTPTDSRNVKNFEQIKELAVEFHRNFTYTTDQAGSSSGGRTSERAKPSSGAGKKQRTYGQHSPLLYCFSDHDILQVRLTDLKPIQTSLTQFQRVLDKTEGWARLVMVLEMLWVTIKQNMDGEEVYEVDEEKFSGLVKDKGASLVGAVTGKRKTRGRKSDPVDSDDETSSVSDGQPKESTRSNSEDEFPSSGDEEEQKSNDAGSETQRSRRGRKVARTASVRGRGRGRPRKSGRR